MPPQFVPLPSGERYKMNRTKSKATRMKSLRTPLDPARLETQRTIVRVAGLTKKQWNDRVELARSREVIWNNPDIREMEDKRMDDFLGE